MDYEKIRDEILDFRDKRDWKQFHTPENLAKSKEVSTKYEKL